MQAQVLDELAFAGPEHLDPAYVASYDRKAHLDPSVDLAHLCERGLGTDSTLVDLGAGTGTFAFAAAPLCKRVVSVDISPAMVATMRARATASGITNFECIHAGFLSYEHTGPPADFVYTRNALHHLPDFWKAIALHRIAQLLRPGGVLHLEDLVFAFAPHEAEERIVAWLANAADHADDGWTSEELEVHLRTEHSTFTWLLEPMIERAGFQIEELDYGELGIYAYYLCSKPTR
jgi:SAM-dependent methyltransferase